MLSLSRMSKAVKSRGKSRKKTARGVSLKETRRLLKIVKELRELCPWDRKQTHQSLVKYLIEEAYETADAIERKNPSEMQEELGDVLLQVALHAEIAGERGLFSFEDIAKSIADKMVRRHPHIYEKKKAYDLKNHLRNWNQLKSEEKPKAYLLEGIPRLLPALQLAQRYGEAAASVSFDWQTPEEVFEKVKEELGEFSEEMTRSHRKRDRLEMEMGDLLFTLSHLARHLGFDAETALRKSSQKFAARLTKIEEMKRGEGKRLADCSAPELEAAWNHIKAQ